MKTRPFSIAIALGLIAIFAACQVTPRAPTLTPLPRRTPTPIVTPGPTPTPTPSGPRLLSTISLGTGVAPHPGRIMAADPVTEKVYLASQDLLSVMDTTTHKVRHLRAPLISAMAVDEEAHVLYAVASPGRESVLYVYDAMKSTLQERRLAFTVRDLVVDPATGTLYVAAHTDDKGWLLVIEPRDFSIKSLDVGESPVGRVVVNSASRRAYLLQGAAVIVVNVAEAEPQVMQRVPLVSEPRDLALDSIANRLYLAHQYQNAVSVLDGATLQIKQVAVESQPIFVATNDELHRLYVVHWQARTVSVIDTESNTVVKTVPVGKNPQNLVVDPTSGRVYVVNTDDHTLTVLDGEREARTIPVGKGPYGIAVDAKTGKAYVSNVTDSSVSVIEEGERVAATIKAAPFPAAMALNAANGKLYVANGGQDSLAVIDTQTDRVDKVLGVGDRPRAVAADARANLVYVVNGDNSLSVIHGDSHVVTPFDLTLYPGGSGALSDIVVNPQTGRVYISADEQKPRAPGEMRYIPNPLVFVLDGPNGSIITTTLTSGIPGLLALDSARDVVYTFGYRGFRGGSGEIHQVSANGDKVTLSLGPDYAQMLQGETAQAILVDPARHRLYVSLRYQSKRGLAIVGLAGEIVTTLTDVGTPAALALDEATRAVYALDREADKLWILEGASTRGVAVGKAPVALALDVARRRAYVVNEGDDSLSIVDVGQGAVIGTVKVGAGPRAVVVKSEARKVYVLSYLDSSISVVFDP